MKGKQKNWNCNLLFIIYGETDLFLPLPLLHPAQILALRFELPHEIEAVLGDNVVEVPLVEVECRPVRRHYFYNFIDNLF